MKPQIPSNCMNHRVSRGRSSQRGFSILEVMMSLSVLGVGILSLLTLQLTAVGANMSATHSSVANSIAQTWADRLVRDSTVWTQPSQYNTVSNLKDTLWLKVADQVPNGAVWTAPADRKVNGILFSTAFDFHGVDVASTSTNAAYCVNLRLTNPAAAPGIVIAEIRVYWPKQVAGNPTLLSNYKMGGAICLPGLALDALGADTQNFNWLYTTTTISQARP